MFSLENKIALVTGVGDNDSFAWHIARFLQAASARILLSQLATRLLGSSPLSRMMSFMLFRMLSAT